MKVDDFFVMDESGQKYRAVTEQEFEVTNDELVPTEEHTYCMMPLSSNNDYNYTSVETEEKTEYTSTSGTKFLRAPRTKGVDMDSFDIVEAE